MNDLNKENQKSIDMIELRIYIYIQVLTKCSQQNIMEHITVQPKQPLKSKAPKLQSIYNPRKAVRLIKHQ